MSDLNELRAQIASYHRVMQTLERDRMAQKRDIELLRERAEKAEAELAQAQSALRAILAVTDRHDTATFNVISDAARAALEKKP